MTISAVVLLVDDDPAIRDSLSKELRAAGYTTVTATNGAEGLTAVQSHAPDVILTDLAMPRSDGFELISALRASSAVPIVVLSVRGGDADKVRALDLGADDFVTKPFSVNELLARVRAQLRRTSTPPPTVLSFHELTIDLERRRVVQGGREVRLTPIEFNLLLELASRAGDAVSHEALLTKVWGPEYRTEGHYLKVYIGRLRDKMESDPASPRLIETVRGVGYRFALIKD